MAMLNKNVVTKVVGALEVENYTMQGWRVAEVVQDQHVESFCESTPFLPQGQNYPVTGSGTKGFLVTKNLFVMTKDGSSLIAEANERVAAAERRGNEVATLLIEADKKTEEWKKEAGKLLKGHENYVYENQKLSERLEAERKQKVKMENDIAKIRNAVGELKMKEILGA